MTCRYPGCGRPAYVAGRWCYGGHMLQPRYCTCYGDVPAPDVIGMCPDCLRLVETKAVA